MHWLPRILALSCLLGGLATAPAGAATPDPVAFGHAVERGDLGAVRRWLDEGLDPEYQADRVGTGLMLAAWNGNIEMMALFVERGADPRRSNRHGEQALQLAAWNGHAAAVDWLLANGATLNREDLQWNALHYAVFNGHEKLAGSLIARGADVNARSPNGSTPLMLAAREGREALAGTLLAAGADPNVRNDWGDSALTLAMRYDHYRVGKLISSSEAFSEAVRTPKASFGQPSRSSAAPSEIEAILQRMRETEAAGQPTDALRKQLFTAVESFRRGATPSAQAARRPAPRPYQPKSIVITARRNQPGAERAEVLGAARPASGKAAAVGAEKSLPASAAKPSPAEISALVRQIRLAEAQGQPADDLKRRLAEAVDALGR